MPSTIFIDNVEYPLASEDGAYTTESQGQFVREEWRDGFLGGMGSFRRGAADDYLFGHNVDTTTFPYVRLHPGFTSISVASLGINANHPVYFFFDESANGGQFVYVLNGANSFKINLSDNSVEETKAFGSGTCGRPVYFESKWFVALGASTVAQTLDTVANAGGTDTWTPLDYVSHHFSKIIDPPDAKIVRVRTGHEIATSATGADLVSYGSPFEIGDSGHNITDMLEAQGELIVIRPDNLFKTDAQGNAIPLQEFVGNNPSKTNIAFVGANSTQHGPYTYWAHTSGLYRVIGQQRFINIGPEGDSRWLNRTLDSFIPLITGGPGWLSVTTWGNWIYATNFRSLFAGEIIGDGLVRWHGVIYQDSSNQIRCGITEGPILWVANTSQTLRRFTLNEDGSLRTSLGSSHGTINGTFRFWLPVVEGPREIASKNKQWRYMWADLEGDWNGEVTLTLKAHLNGATTPTAVGSGITASGHSEQAWAVGTEDTARYIIPELSFVTTANYDTSDDPRVTAFGVEGVTPSVYRAKLDIRQAHKSRGVTALMKTLRNLKNGPAVTIRDPIQKAVSFTGYIVGLRESSVGDESGPGMGFEVDVLIERFDWDGA